MLRELLDTAGELNMVVHSFGGSGQYRVTYREDYLKSKPGDKLDWRTCDNVDEAIDLCIDMRRERSEQEQGDKSF